MSIWYLTSSNLHADFNEKNLKTILKRSEDLGFHYYNFTQHKILTTEEAFKSIIIPDEDGLRVVDVKYRDVSVGLIVIKTNDHITISIDCTLDWTKDFSGVSKQYSVKRDNSRFMSLLLDICSDFCIAKFQLTSDYSQPLEQPTKWFIAQINMGINGPKQFGHDVGFIFSNAWYSSIKLILYESEIQTENFMEMLKYFEEMALIDQQINCKAHCNNYHFTLHIKPGYIKILPQEPYKIKTTAENSCIDLVFYLEILLRLCDNFSIEELQAIG